MAGGPGARRARALRAQRVRRALLRSARPRVRPERDRAGRAHRFVPRELSLLMGRHAFRPVLAIALLIGAAFAHAQVDEATRKAAFVYNFALYTSWPAPPGEPHALTLC